MIHSGLSSLAKDTLGIVTWVIYLTLLLLFKMCVWRGGAQACHSTQMEVRGHLPSRLRRGLWFTTVSTRVAGLQGFFTLPQKLGEFSHVSLCLALHGFWGLKAGDPTCAASTVSTEPSPQGLVLNSYLANSKSDFVYFPSSSFSSFSIHSLHFKKLPDLQIQIQDPGDIWIVCKQ